MMEDGLWFATEKGPLGPQKNCRSSLAIGYVNMSMPFGANRVRISSIHCDKRVPGTTIRWGRRGICFSSLRYGRSSDASVRKEFT